MLFRIISVVAVLMVAIFCCRQLTFSILLAPTSSDFVTYRIIENLASVLGFDFSFSEFKVQLINTELSSQFVTHITTSFYLGLLLSSPYIVIELFRFISPALYEHERHNSIVIAVAVYVLFILGVLMSYSILFPFALRFLGTYQVDESIVNQINLSSYISTFTSLTFMLGLVFQIPIVSLFAARMGILRSDTMAHYRKHAIVVIMLIAAIITPPDLFTQIVVTVPMYFLYEASILIVKRQERHISSESEGTAE